MFKKRINLIILLLICALAYSLCHYMTYRNVPIFRSSGALRTHSSYYGLWTPMVARHESEHSDVGVNVQSSQQCSEVLNKTVHGYNDLNDYVNVCSRVETSDADKTRMCESCRFKTPVYMDENKPFVALASYGGSGNSWTRELLESVTGLYTGSIYVDSAGQFPGSKRCPNRGGVYIIKTHRYDDRITDHGDCSKMQVKTIYYQRAMYILRNPYDAILSAFNLVNTGDKLGFATRDAFRSEKWRHHVKGLVPEWKRMTLGWLTKFERPVHVIVYENLRKHTVNELFAVGQFLQLNNSYIDLYCAKSCLKPKYHRAKPEWMNTSILYDDDLKRTVNYAINDVSRELSRINLDYIVKVLKQYIMLPHTAYPISLKEHIQYFLGV